jgi:hypothetical protein
MLKTLSTIFCLVVLSVTAIADTKVKSRQTSGGQTYENTSYIKGKRQRSETNGGQMVTVTQCDLRRNITIMPAMRTYMIQPYDQPSTSTAPTTTTTPTTTPSTATKKGGLVTSTVTTRDTGERKQMFGYTARHIITTMVMDSSPDACSETKMKMETDGWYIDAAFALDCDLGSSYTPPRTHASGGCQDRYQTKQIGAAKKGYPVYEKTTMFGPDGRETFSTITEVVEFSQATLDPALFDVPAGYREVQDYASLYGAPAGVPSAADMAAAVSGADTGNVPSSSPSTSSSTKPDAVVPPKKTGMIRIGVVTVKADKTAEGMNAANLATAVHATLLEKLKAPKVEAVPIQATVLNQIEAEARQKECDYIVYTTVSHKKGGGGFGSVFGSTAAQVAAATVPYGGSATAAIATNTAASVVVADIKARDELTVDVRLEKPGAGYPAFSKQFKGKAKAGGEDIITPPTTQAAQGVIEAATKQ